MVRGIEGDGQRVISACSDSSSEKTPDIDGRNRRPPRDGVNALLSFVYSILGRTSAARFKA